LSHASMAIFATYMKDAFRYTFTAWRFLQEEYYIIATVLGIGIIAGLLPAIMAFRTDIAKTLSGN
jgi:putative ABC transport system permease protein